MCFRVAVFLWRLLPPGPAKLKRVQLYHAMCWPDENDETTRLLRDDAECQIVIATIAFGQGFNLITPFLRGAAISSVKYQESNALLLYFVARSEMLYFAKSSHVATRTFFPRPLDDACR